MNANRNLFLVVTLLLTLFAGLLPLSVAAGAAKPAAPDNYNLQGDFLNELGNTITLFQTSSGTLDGGWRFTEAFTNGVALRAECNSGANCRGIYAQGAGTGVVAQGGTYGVRGYTTGGASSAGGHFTSTAGSGVVGQGLIYGVRGISTGNSTSSAGFFSSTGGNGITTASQNRFALLAESAGPVAAASISNLGTGPGLNVNSNADGIVAISSDNGASKSRFGVFGGVFSSHPDTAGVFGQGANGATGVLGIAFGANGQGVVGRGPVYGVRGSTSGNSTSASGGYSDSTVGTGLYAASSSGTGVYATSTSSFALFGFSQLALRHHRRLELVASASAPPATPGSGCGSIATPISAHASSPAAAVGLRVTTSIPTPAVSDLADGNVHVDGSISCSGCIQALGVPTSQGERLVYSDGALAASSMTGRATLKDGRAVIAIDPLLRRRRNSRRLASS